MRIYSVFRPRHLIKMVAFALLSSPASAISENWDLIGQDALVAGTKIFLKRDALEGLGEGNLYVMTLTVYPMTVRGIDLPTADGETRYDTRYPHRSYVQISVYDCPRRMSAVGQTLYFSGTRPKENELVYKQVEDEALLLPEVFDDPVFNVVCD